MWHCAHLSQHKAYNATYKSVICVLVWTVYAAQQVGLQGDTMLNKCNKPNNKVPAILQRKTKMQQDMRVQQGVVEVNLFCLEVLALYEQLSGILCKQWTF